ncbi:MAG: cytochrome c-type biogenesis protein CcmH, partial [Brevundimonas sp.]
GATDQAVRDDLVRRFGDYVLFTPPVRAGTWLLWFGPFALAALALLVILVRAGRGAVEAQPLSPDEERRLQDILANEKLRRDLDATSPHDGR